MKNFTASEIMTLQLQFSDICLFLLWKICNVYSGKLRICRDHPYRRLEIKCCIMGGLQEIVLKFEFNQNRSSGFGAVGGGPNLPFPIDLGLSHLLKRRKRVTGSVILSRSGRVTGQCVRPDVWHGF